jgi:hypothetical protein
MPCPEALSKGSGVSENGISSLLGRLGLSSETIQKVKFRGVIGKLSLIGIYGVVVLGLIGVRSSDSTVQLILGVLVFVVFIGTVVGILAYSHKHPGEGTLEGTEVILWRQQEILAAKGAGLLPPESPKVVAPGQETEPLGTEPDDEGEE